MLFVSAKQPIFDIVQRYNYERLVNDELNAKVVDLEKKIAAMSMTAPVTY